MVSLADLLTATKNIVTSISSASQAYLQVNGAQNLTGITTLTAVSTAAGRFAVVSVIVAGSTTGTVYDSNSTTILTRPLFTIPNTLGVFFVNMPTTLGLVVSPGTGMTVSVSYS